MNDNTNQPTTIEPLDGEMRERRLPCPFCGGTGRDLLLNQGGGYHRIGCTCGIVIVRDTREEVLEAWNTRTPSAEVKAALSDERERIVARIGMMLDTSRYDFQEMVIQVNDFIDSLRNPADIDGEGEKHE